jgi:hypothetical protein
MHVYDTHTLARGNPSMISSAQMLQLDLMIQVYRLSADVGGLAALDDAGTHVAADGPLEDLHHEREQRARERGVPAAFGRLVPNEGMLRLHLEELCTLVRPRSRPGTVRRRTETGMFESSSVLRMRSRPARGTWVSCWRALTTVLRRHAAQVLACLPKIICPHGQAPLMHMQGERDIPRARPFRSDRPRGRGRANRRPRRASRCARPSRRSRRTRARGGRTLRGTPAAGCWSAGAVGGGGGAHEVAAETHPGRWAGASAAFLVWDGRARTGDAAVAVRERGQQVDRERRVLGV